MIYDVDKNLKDLLTFKMTKQCLNACQLQKCTEKRFPKKLKLKKI